MTVYDDVAGHHTTVHSLDEDECARIRAAEAGAVVGVGYVFDRERRALLGAERR